MFGDMPLVLERGLLTVEPELLRRDFTSEAQPQLKFSKVLTLFNPCPLDFTCFFCLGKLT